MVRHVVEQGTGLLVVVKTGSRRMHTPVFWLLSMCVLRVCFWQVGSLIFKEREEPLEAGNRKYSLRYEGAIFDRSDWCKEFELWEREWLCVDSEIRDKWRKAQAVLLFVCLWVVLVVCVCMQMFALHSSHGAVECYTFPLQSASFALAPMTSLRILPASSLSSLPLSHPFLPLISLSLAFVLS